MLGYYTRDFRAGNTEAAVDYLTLICLNADLPGAMGKSQAALCHEALRELVLETREFAQLLGDIQGDGTRLKGAVELRLKLINLEDQEDFLKNVTLQAASVADDNGRTTDAVLLYHLAEDYDNVIVIINRALSEAISVDIGEVGMRLQPLKPRQELPNQQQPAANSSLSLTSVDDPSILAHNMISLYDTNALYYQKIRLINREICGILLRMDRAKTKVANGQWAEAIDVSAYDSMFPQSNVLTLFSGHIIPQPPPSPRLRLYPYHSQHGHLIQCPYTACISQYRAPTLMDDHMYRQAERSLASGLPVRERNKEGHE